MDRRRNPLVWIVVGNGLLVAADAAAWLLMLAWRLLPWIAFALAAWFA